MQQALGQRRAAHQRHDHVGNQQVDLLEALGDLQRVLPVFGGVDDVAVRGEPLVDQLTHAVFVLDQQQRRRRARVGRRRVASLAGTDGSSASSGISSGSGNSSARGR